MRNTPITFERSLSKEILAIFNIGSDEDGYAVDSFTKKRVFAFDGKEFLIKDFAGVAKGKDGRVLLLRSDSLSLIETMGLI